MALTKPRLGQINTGGGTLLASNAAAIGLNDNLISLNDSVAGTNTKDIGLWLNRGTSGNLAVVWVEADSTFALVGTSSDATANTVTVTGLKDLKAANITANGNVTTTAANSGLVSGVLGQSYVGGFNGTNQYLEIASGSEFTFDTGNWTIECWIYPTLGGVNQGIISKNYNINSSAGPFVVEFDTNNIPGLYACSNGGGSGWDVTALGATPATLNAWNHLAVTRNGNDFTVWLNGTLSATVNTSFTEYDNSSVPVTIGSSDSVGSWPFSGYISNVRIVKGLAVYTGNFTVPTGPLQATQPANPFGGSNTAAITGTQTALLTLEDATVVDNSTFAHSITNHGSVSTTTQTTSFGGSTVGTFLYNGAAWEADAIDVGVNLTASAVTVSGKINVTPTATVVGTTATVIDSFSASEHRGAKYIVTVSNSPNYAITECMVVHDGTTASLITYGEILTGNNLGTFSVGINSGNVELSFTGVTTNNSVKVSSQLIAV